MNNKIFFSLFLVGYSFGSDLVTISTANAPNCDSVFFLSIPGSKNKIQIPFSSQDRFDQLQTRVAGAVQSEPSSFVLCFDENKQQPLSKAKYEGVRQSEAGMPNFLYLLWNQK